MPALQGRLTSAMGSAAACSLPNCALCRRWKKLRAVDVCLWVLMRAERACKCLPPARPPQRVPGSSVLFDAACRPEPPPPCSLLGQGLSVSCVVVTFWAAAATHASAREVFGGNNGRAARASELGSARRRVMVPTVQGTVSVREGVERGEGRAASVIGRGMRGRESDQCGGGEKERAAWHMFSAKRAAGGKAGRAGRGPAPGPTCRDLCTREAAWAGDGPAGPITC